MRNHSLNRRHLNGKGETSLGVNSLGKIQGTRLLCKFGQESPPLSLGVGGGWFSNFGDCHKNPQRIGLK